MKSEGPRKIIPEDYPRDRAGDEDDNNNKEDF